MFIGLRWYTAGLKSMKSNFLMRINSVFSEHFCLCWAFLETHASVVTLTICICWLQNHNNTCKSTCTCILFVICDCRGKKHWNRSFEWEQLAKHLHVALC
jgi:hypothetical protein